MVCYTVKTFFLVIWEFPKMAIFNLVGSDIATQKLIFPFHFLKCFCIFYMNASIQNISLKDYYRLTFLSINHLLEID